MISLIVILVIIATLAGIKAACKLISKLILLFIGFVVVSALLSTAYVFMKLIFKVALMALCICVIVGICKKFLLD